MKKSAKLALELKNNYSTNNPFELCDYLDICFLFFDLPQNVKGFYTMIGGNKVIYLNTSLSETDRRVVCAHELGHALLHERENVIFLSEKTYNVCSKLELEADTFCAYLLLDEIDALDEMMTYEKIICESGLPRHIVELRYNN